MTSTVKITHKIKDKIWKDYTKNIKSKDELKQMFMGANPTSAYKKISDKLKKQINKETNSPSRKVKSPSRKVKSPDSILRYKTISPSEKHKSLSRKVKSPSRIIRYKENNTKI